MHIVIIGDVSDSQSYHVGDEAMLAANIEIAKQFIPSVTITAVSRHPSSTADAYGIAAVPYVGFSACASDAERDGLLDDVISTRRDDGSWVNDTLDAVSRADVLIISGGGNLSSDWPHHIYERAALASAAQSRDIPVVVWGQTIGPHLLAHHRQIVARLLQSADWVGMREVHSFALASRLGVEQHKLHYQADDAIGLTPERPTSPVLMDLVDDDVPFIAVTIHPIDDPERPSGNLGVVARALRELAGRTSARLVFIPHQRIAAGEKGWSDREFGIALARDMADDAMFVADLLPAQQVLWLTARADLVVSTRYHPLVFGLSSGVASLGIATDHYTWTKLDGARRHAVEGAEVCDLSEVASGALVERGMHLWETRRSTRPHLEGWMKRWRADRFHRLQALQSLMAPDAPAAEGAESASPASPSSAEWGAVTADLSERCLVLVEAAAVERSESARQARLLQDSRDHALAYARDLERVLTDKEAALEEITADLNQRRLALVEAAAVERSEGARQARLLQDSRDQAVAYARDLERVLTDKQAALAGTILERNPSGKAAGRDHPAQAREDTSKPRSPLGADGTAGERGAALPLRRAAGTTGTEQPMFTEQQWSDYQRDGYMHLGQVLDEDEIRLLTQRADDLAMGYVENSKIQMQLDTGGAYEDVPAAVDKFDEGTSLYRKIQGLENDDVFIRLIQKLRFNEVCRTIYGRHTSISIFRAMIMNKPAGQDTYLPWHQDGGHVWQLDRDPLVTIWVALDPATQANGCMDVVPGTHKLGMLSLFGSTVRDDHVAIHCSPDRVLPLEVPAGHAVLIHNWLIRRSGVNPSAVPRRAFTMCCMDARTISILTGHHFPVIYGEPPEVRYPFVSHLEQERAFLASTASQAEAYALSLREQVASVETSVEEASRYATSLEHELTRLREERNTIEVYAKSLEAELSKHQTASP